MIFDVAADSYQRFMGRYSDPLSALFVDALAPTPGSRALDVGAGTGALTAQLARVLGEEAVAAVEPSPPFLAALRERLPRVDARLAPAEAIPFAAHAFDLTVAGLVVNFMTEPLVGIAEMRRVTRSGGRVAASLWDFSGGRAPLSLFWRAASAIDPAAEDEAALVGARPGYLGELFESAGLHEVRSGELTVRVPYADFEEWWTPYTLGVGPAGAYVTRLDDEARAALRRECEALLGPGPGAIEGTAVTTVGVV
ncbi:class I SAM-dependent methyltransferase [Galbitalea soli]|uniref:Methyltransferase domain-containing protein n=1 Tax=Galbitalea soli TaxID=1268042 RepID=A0A7C9TMR6_9MICO|nr:methyltransferase domain-containing protein [Galbitalea soli]NEM89936.1 methyltransferase domain-containing protein [Galbitalea soli]NYJ30642.1 SAM-dependent methyltransferase [Galbitalea soli]